MLDLFKGNRMILLTFTKKWWVYKIGRDFRLGMNLLTVENVTKTVGGRVLFDHVSIGLNEGDKAGIIGINGTGKSTLLKVIAGLEEIDSGTVTKKIQ